MTLSNPYYRIAQTDTVASRKSRASMWNVYQWILGKNIQDGNVEIVDTKSGSVWTSAATLSNNDWFVARFTTPSIPNGAPFDIWVQATDSLNLSVDPLNQRGLFVRMGSHFSGEAWNGTGGAYGTPYFKSGSYIFPVADQMAIAGGLSGTSNSLRIHVVGDDNWMIFVADTEDGYKEYDAGFLVGHYGRVRDEGIATLLLVTGTFNRSEPGNPLDSDATCGWRMAATSIGAGTELDVTGRGNNGTPAGAITIGGSGSVLPNSQWGKFHSWNGGGVSGTSTIKVPDDTDWELGTTGLGFTHAWWCRLEGSGYRNLVGTSGINFPNNGPVVVTTDAGTVFGAYFSGNAGVIDVSTSLLSSMSHVVFSVAPVGGTSVLYINGVQVGTSSRISALGSRSYPTGRYLTIGSLARDTNPNTIVDPWDGDIADYVVYSSAKTAEWAYRQWTRSIGFAHDYLIPPERGGVLAWKPSITDWAVLPLKMVSNGGGVLSSGWQKDGSWIPAGYDEVQILIKSVIDSGVSNGYLVGGMLELRSAYGETNRMLRPGEGRIVLGGIDKLDESVSIIGNGTPPAVLQQWTGTNETIISNTYGTFTYGTVTYGG